MATGNLRNKVALKPGHSLMDWIRLGHSGEDLSGTRGAILNVTPAELAKHNKREDAWICIRGKVFNMTRYLDFHPGGVDELMRGAGIDATNIFNEVHSWVNYESILQKCLVGRLRNPIDEDVFGAVSRPSKKSTSLLPPPTTQPSTSSSSSEAVKFDWYQKKNEIFIVFYIKQPPLDVHLVLSPDLDLWVRIGTIWKGWKLQEEVVWPPVVDITQFKIEIVMEKQRKSLWDGLQELKTSPPTSNGLPEFWNSKISSMQRITHNVYLISTEYNNRVFNYIPLGRHILLKASIKGKDIERPYTPVESLQGEPLDRSKLWFIVKDYPDGVFSHWLTSSRLNESIQVSSPLGSFVKTNIARVDVLVLLAAGTGITPMIRLISYALISMQVSLKFFNKSENDIIWKEEFARLSEKNEKFDVEHILSEPSSAWEGKRGWITPQLLESFLPEVSLGSPVKYYVAVCGPQAFTQLVEGYIERMGYTSKNYFCFRG